MTGSETRLEPLDLRTEVDLALGDLSAAIEETGARIDIDIPPIVVTADRAQLGRLIQNIVSNAIKYHKPGAAPAIAIRAARSAPRRRRSRSPTTELVSTRSSPGRFSSRSSGCTTGREYSGSGIGLAICKAIADRYGWTIAVRSRPGEGATSR